MCLISAALQRFYEFLNENMFNNMSNQSERQLGAFMVLYALEFSEVFTPNKKTVEFRSKTIHKRVIPTPAEAEEFCSQVYKQIAILVNRLKSTHASFIEDVVSNDLANRTAKLPKGTLTSTGTNFFSLLANKDGDEDFNKTYQNFLQMIEQVEAWAIAMRGLSAT